MFVRQCRLVFLTQPPLLAMLLLSFHHSLPGVFFFYEVSPLHVEITETYRQGWVAFFTSVCAVIGGVVSVMGMVDQFLFAQKRTDGLAR
jgi:hypothetical protein